MWLRLWWPITLISSIAFSFVATAAYKEYAAKSYMHPNKRYNSACVITGGTHGIGFAIAKLFARDGYNLILVARHEEDLTRAKRELLTINRSIKVFLVSQDLYTEKGADHTYADITKVAMAERLHVDHVVNNVGMCIRGDFLELPLLDQLAMMQLNMFNMVKLTYMFGNQFKEEIKKGSNTQIPTKFRFMMSASFASLIVCPFLSVYSGTKAFVHAFAVAFNEELKHDKYKNQISCTSLCPGYTMAPSLVPAGILNSVAIKLQNYDSPDRVARVGYRAMMEGESYILLGFFNNITYWATLFMPTQLTSKLAKFFNADWDTAVKGQGLEAKEGWPQNPSATSDMRHAILTQKQGIPAR